MENDHLQLLINIDNKVSEVKDKIHSIELIQTRMESDLKYHIKRTDLLEEKLLHVDEKIKPFEIIKNLFSGSAKTFAMFSGAIAAILTIIKNLSAKH